MPRFVTVMPSLVLALLSTTTLAQDPSTGSGQVFPNRVIRIVTSGVGGGSDFVARLVAQGITGPLGQPVIVDNRPNSVIAAEFVTKAAPDGYTLMSWGSAMWIGALLQKMPYDAVRDFTPVILVGRAPSILVVHPSLPVNSVKELIALARAKPGELNYATSSTGSPTHLAGEMFNSMAKVKIIRINYKGSGPAVTGVMSGEAQLHFANVSAVMPQVKSGRLKALAVTSATPFALAPDLPTVAAAGLPGYEVASADCILAPAKLPAAVLARLYQEIARYLKTPEAKEKLFNAGTEVTAGSPEQLGALIKSEIVTMGKLIRDAGIKVE